MPKGEQLKSTQFKKGNTAGTAKARYKGISKYIKDKTNNLFDVVDLAVKIIHLPAKSATERTDRRWAADYLTDRAIGKAIAHVEQTGDININVDMPKDIDINDM